MQYDKIDENLSLIILKFEKLTNNAAQKNVQYEIYEPINKTKLDLSICGSTSIDLYIPITLSDETQTLYDDLKPNRYILFNINDSFYQDICTINQKMELMFYYRIEKMIIIIIMNNMSSKL